MVDDATRLDIGLRPRVGLCLRIGIVPLKNGTFGAHGYSIASKCQVSEHSRIQAPTVTRTLPRMS